MKILLYVIAGLLVVTWSIVFLSFNAPDYVHMLLAAAAVVILIPPLLSDQKPNLKKSDSFR